MLISIGFPEAESLQNPVGIVLTTQLKNNSGFYFLYINIFIFDKL